MHAWFRVPPWFQPSMKRLLHAFFLDIGRFKPETEPPAPKTPTRRPSADFPSTSSATAVSSPMLEAPGEEKQNLLKKRNNAREETPPPPAPAPAPAPVNAAVKRKEQWLRFIMLFDKIFLCVMLTINFLSPLIIFGFVPRIQNIVDDEHEILDWDFVVDTHAGGH